MWGAVVRLRCPSSWNTIGVKSRERDLVLVNHFSALPCRRINGESAWESNPPTTLVTPPTRFEDEGHHRATPALARSVPVAESLSIPLTAIPRRALQNRDRRVPGSRVGCFRGVGLIRGVARCVANGAEEAGAAAHVRRAREAELVDRGQPPCYAASGTSARWSRVVAGTAAGTGACPRASRPSQSCRLRTAHAWNNWHCAAARPTRRACRQPL